MSVTVQMNFDGFQRQFEIEVAAMVYQQSRIFRGEMSKLLLTSGKSPPPSAAGQVPHNLTGNLGRSWKSSKSRRDGKAYKSSVFTSVVYAAALQFGYTPRGLAPRPYVTKAIEKASPRMKRSVNVPAMVARAAARSAI